jgi:hypothetical protein
MSDFTLVTKNPNMANWNHISQYHTDLGEYFMEEYQEFVNWDLISQYQNYLSKEFVEKFQDCISTGLLLPHFVFQTYQCE